MAKVKAEILCGNIYLNDRKCLKGETETIDSKLADTILEGDKEAGREPRIKFSKPRKRKTETENGENS